ncbi:uncharacterized protein METZ01_LOCUS100360, partial [marine metagenome]
LAVKILTKIPGPNSLTLAKRRAKSVSKGHGSVCDVYIKEANGSILKDV